jgi:redox-sensitive bicupin YhaK (pirin superfamily)
MADPFLAMFWDSDIPRVTTGDGGCQAVVTVIAGNLGSARAPLPPPASWAARADADVAIWHVRLDPGATWTMPPAAHAETVRTVYFFEGDAVSIDGVAVEPSTGVVVDSSAAARLASTTGAECLILQGRPIGEPVAQYGPFVMNDRAGIEQAFDDYRRTGFGGWPWPADGPVHGADGPRFVRRPDGSVEHPRMDAHSN